MISRKNFKVVLLGDVMTGKTCLVKRYFQNTFSDKERRTIGAAFESKLFDIDGMEYQMAVWDTSGEERFHSICRLYYRDAKAAIICYDVSQRETFKKLEFWMKDLIDNEPDCQIYICATKSDLLDLIEFHNAIPSLSFAKSFAKEKSVKFFLTSSKTGENVDKLFDEILKDVIDQWKNSLEFSTTIKLPIFIESRKRQKRKCCSSH